MAIAFGRAGHNSAGGSPASPLVVTVTINAGETGVVCFENTGGTGGVTSITGGGTWTKRTSNAYTSGPRVFTEIWTTDANAAAGTASLSIAYNGAPVVVAAVGAAYTGVGSLGAAATPGGVTESNPSIALVTQDANNWAIAAFGSNDGTAATAGTGNLRDQANLVGASDGFVALNDNTAASPSSVTNSITHVNADTSKVAFELRSVAGGATLLPFPVLGRTSSYMGSRMGLR
jgi:hypothetical protein